jgi:hypothetical protein
VQCSKKDGCRWVHCEVLRKGVGPHIVDRASWILLCVYRVCVRAGVRGDRSGVGVGVEMGHQLPAGDSLVVGVGGPRSMPGVRCRGAF